MSDDTKTSSTPTADWWGKWFFRVVNVFGLVLIAHEALVPRTGEPGSGPNVVVLCVGLACVTGATGINLLLNYFGNKS